MERKSYNPVRDGATPETMTPQHTGSSTSTTSAEPSTSRFTAANPFESVTSRSPLAQFPVPHAGTDTYGQSSGFDAERGAGPVPTHRPGLHGFGSNWDLMGAMGPVLAPMKKLEEDAQAYDPRMASEKHLAFADGDLPDNKVCQTRVQSVMYVLNTSPSGHQNLLLLAQRVCCHAMDLVHHSCSVYPLDSWHCLRHGIPSS
jgi:hypothetical protein